MQDKMRIRMKTLFMMNDLNLFMGFILVNLNDCLLIPYVDGE